MLLGWEGMKEIRVLYKQRLAFFHTLCAAGLFGVKGNDNCK